MAALLVTIGVMSLMLSAAMPVWRQMVKREKEAELVFRGEQYARAIGLFQRKFAGAFPPNLDVLVEQKFLRRKYRDPMTEDGEFQILYQLQQSGPGGAPSGTASLPGQPATEQPPSALQTGPQTGPQTAAGGTSLAGPRGGIIGVTSKSEEPSLLLYNGRSQYNEWQFVYVDLAAQAGGGGNPGQMPGGPGAPQGGGMGPGQFPGAGGPGGFPPGGGGLGRGGSGFGGSFPGGTRPPR